MDDANHKGLDISADVYPYTFWQSTITVLIPTRNWEDRTAWQKGLDEVGGPSHIRLTAYSPNPEWVGRSIAQIASDAGKDAISIIQEVVRKTHGPGSVGHESVVVEAMLESDLDQFIHSPRIMFCTDGGLKPTHPRGAGSYPRILGRYVRDRHVLRLEEAIRKMTSLPAARMGFRDRGTIKPGLKADIVAFDANSVIDTATIEHPAAPPIGIPFVFVNGALILDRGHFTGARTGQVIRRLD
jgi:N-acyl-D-amino-acid deacylase